MDFTQRFVKCKANPRIGLHFYDNHSGYSGEIAYLEGLTTAPRRVLSSVAEAANETHPNERDGCYVLLSMLVHGPIHAMSASDSAVKALLMNMEREWDDAAVAKNASVLERILADDWTYWDTQSQFKTKA